MPAARSTHTVMGLIRMTVGKTVLLPHRWCFYRRMNLLRLPGATGSKPFSSFRGEAPDEPTILHVVLLRDC